jgi:hypothetical protein
MIRVRRSGTATVAPERWPRSRRVGHWSSLFGEIALYAFVVLVATGAFLTVFFDPDMTQAGYDGSYGPLRGVPVSGAYASTLEISFDVRGGLLVRQIHHWAALIFIAAVCLQLMRMFFTGAFRRPAGRNWLIWVILLTLGMGAGLTGTILPDDMLSGGSLGLLQGVTQSIPMAGTRLTFWLFGGDFPGDTIIPRLYRLHVLLLPVGMAGLLALRSRLARRHGRVRSPVPVALCFATWAVLALLGTFAQVNPVPRRYLVLPGGRVRRTRPGVHRHAADLPRPRVPGTGGGRARARDRADRDEPGGRLHRDHRAGPAHRRLTHARCRASPGGRASGRPGVTP